MAGLYVYDNTLLGIKLTGAQVKDFLEYSAKYFAQVAPGAPINLEHPRPTRAARPTTTTTSSPGSTTTSTSPSRSGRASSA